MARVMRIGIVTIETDENGVKYGEFREVQRSKRASDIRAALQDIAMHMPAHEVWISVGAAQRERSFALSACSAQRERDLQDILRIAHG